MEGGNNFAELAHDFGVDGFLDAGVGIGIGIGDDFEEKLVAGTVVKTGVLAVVRSGAGGGPASFAPMEGDALDGC